MICERQGEESKPNHKRGKISYTNQSYVLTKTRYLITCDPRHAEYQEGERVALVESHNVVPFFEGNDPAVYAEQFTEEMYQWTDTHRGNKKAPKDVLVDRVISFSTDDNVTPEEAMNLAKEAVGNVMGALDSRLSLFVVHTDKKHTHVHFLASTTDEKGKVWNPREDDKVWNKEMTRLEKEHNLTQVRNRKKAPKKKPSGNALQRKKRTGEPTLIELHQFALDDAIEQSQGDFAKFLTALAAHNMLPVANMRKVDGPIRGMGFFMNGEYFAAGDLGTDYRWGNLKKKIGFADAKPEQREALFKLLQFFSAEDNKKCEIAKGSKPAPAPKKESRRNASPIHEQVSERLTERPDRYVDDTPSKPPKLKGKPVRVALYRVFDHQVLGTEIIYTWKSKNNEAFRETVDGDHRLKTRYGLNKAVCTAMVQRAKELGWTTLKVKGSAEYKENIARIALKQGIEVVDINGKPIIPDDQAPISTSWDSLSEREQNRVKQLAETRYKSTDQDAIDKILPEFLAAKEKVKRRYGRVIADHAEDNGNNGLDS